MKRVDGKEFKKIRTGVIGVGSMGQNHARVYSEISNLVAVTDLDKKQGTKVADRLGITYYSDFHEMFSEQLLIHLKQYLAFGQKC